MEPGEAREHGNDPNAVRVHKRGNAGGEGDGEGSAEGRTITGRRDDADRGETREREQSGGRSGRTAEAAESEKTAAGGCRGATKILISALAVLGVVAFAVIFVSRC